MHRFENDRYYLTTDEELLLLGSPDSLAKQRSRGEGPAYIKLGRRVLYRGCDLNGYLDACLITPTVSARGADRREPASDTTQAHGATAA
ncbi:MAG: MerR family transcriptional regulator [Gammaproteobacteria bacterium]|nr:MerR family transcriptional regulator [Gammaproteobacteria bacterium]